MDDSQPTAVEALTSGEDWPLRPWILAALLGIAGLFLHFVTDADDSWAEPLRAAGAAFLFFGSLAAAISLERRRWMECALFGVLAGLLMAGLAWKVSDTGSYGFAEWLSFYSGVFALLLALPLFQAGFHRTRFATDYRQTHFYVWTDAICVAGALAFVGLSWLLLFLLSALFQLLDINLLDDLISEGWFGWTFSGVSAGAALGLLRNQLKILGTLQNVVLMVLSILAVPLAVALVIFLLAMVVSGLDVLWDATESATPVLLACAAGAFILANAIIRDGDETGSGSRILRIAALVLALGILPLTVFAAVSMGLRLGQYGLTPERLWGLVAVIVACAYGLAYLVAVLRGRKSGWGGKLRGANFNLAVGVMGLALFLALPILDFGAISTSNQLARLKSGDVSAKDFDYAALHFDFGPSGEKALAGLAKSDDAEIARLAKAEQKAEFRRWRPEPLEDDDQAERLANLHFQFDDPALQQALEELVEDRRFWCNHACVALDVGQLADGKRRLALVEGRNLIWISVEQVDGGEDVVLQIDPYPVPAIEVAPMTAGQETSVPKVELRPFEGHQIYVDGKPFHQPFQ